jgi:hypothetical protein
MAAKALRADCRLKLHTPPLFPSSHSREHGNLGIVGRIAMEGMGTGHEIMQRRKQALTCDLFLTGTNAVTADGKPYVRQRFTVAHELGHFFMHKKPIVDRARVLRRSLQWDRKELEANVFAAELLTPNLSS